jgi:hypothetical protein
VSHPPLEAITDGLEPIALIVRADYDQPGLQFFTPVSFSQQVAYMRHPSGHKIEAHVHALFPRQVFYTQEVLIIRKGQVRVDLFNSNRQFLCNRILNTGDLILLCGGGHSFEMLEETVMIEIKQGPYTGENDKVRFSYGEESEGCHGDN